MAPIYLGKMVLPSSLRYIENLAYTLCPAHLLVARSSMRLWWVEFRPVLAARSPVSSSRPFLCQASLAALQCHMVTVSMVDRTVYSV